MSPAPGGTHPDEAGTGISTPFPETGATHWTTESNQLLMSHAGSVVLLKRNETETPHEHVTGDIGSGQPAPSLAVGSPVVDHCVRRSWRNYAGVRGHERAVNVELD
jgi:hypothetical protein